MGVIEARDAHHAASHDYPNSKFGSGYMLFTRHGFTEELHEAYLDAWQFCDCTSHTIFKETLAMLGEKEDDDNNLYADKLG